MRFAELCRPPRAISHKLTAGQESWIAKGLETRDALLKKRQAEQGWPMVNTLQESALRRRRGVPGKAELAPLCDLFAQVSKGSAVWDAWKALHLERGWPWLGEDRFLPDWLWMPEPPDGLQTYRSALDAVRAAMDRFEADHHSLTQHEAAQ